MPRDSAATIAIVERGSTGVAEVAASDLNLPAELSRRRLRVRLLIATGVLLTVIAVVTLLPGLGELLSLIHICPGSR